MFTYDKSLATDRDRVRFTIGDTLTTDQQFQDEEIDYLLTQSANVHDCARQLARVLEAKYARYADKWVGDLKITAGQISRRYGALADRLDTMYSAHAYPVAPGLSLSYRESSEANDNLQQGIFSVGMNDHPES